MVITTNPPTTTTLHPISFPAPVFAALSPAPYLLAHLQPPTPHTPPLRPSGRAPSDFRPPAAHTGSLTHASGSAVVRVGDTAAVCGVRGEILLASSIAGWNKRGTRRRKEDEDEDDGEEEIADLGLLVPNLELATGCSPSHLPGSPPSVLAQSLSWRILTLLHATRLVSASDLRIWHQPARLVSSSEEDDEEAEEPEIKAFWVLYIDILFISLDGNAFDAAWGAVLGALGDTRVPNAWWDGDRETVLCDDAVAKAHKLRLNGWPVACSFAVFEPRVGGRTGGEDSKGKAAWVLADPDAFEEGLCRESVTVVVDLEEGGRTKVCRVEKVGGGVVGGGEMRGLVGMAEGRWREWRGVLGR